MGSDISPVAALLDTLISIHALRMGSDHLLWMYSTVRTISIHAPRMGSDLDTSLRALRAHNFNSRSPLGERFYIEQRGKSFKTFQFTLPAWGAMTMCSVGPCCSSISIHAPRMGSDTMLIIKLSDIGNFNSRSPHGERLILFVLDSAIRTFQFTLPA